MPIPFDPLPDVQPVHYTKDIAAVAATSTFSVMGASNTAGQRYRVTRAHILVDATYAADPANFYVITLVHNATTIASWSTQTSAQGALTQFVVNEMVLAADTANNLVVQPNEVMTLVATKNGAAANISARVVCQGKFLQ